MDLREIIKLRNEAENKIFDILSELAISTQAQIKDVELIRVKEISVENPRGAYQYCDLIITMEI